MTTSDPPRLFESAGAPAELKALLALAHEDVLDGAAVERVAAAVRAEIGGGSAPTDPSGSATPADGPAGAGGPGTAGLAPSSTASKLGAAVIVAALASGGLWLARGSDDRPSSQPEPPAPVLALPSAADDEGAGGPAGAAADREPLAAHDDGQQDALRPAPSPARSTGLPTAAGSPDASSAGGTPSVQPSGGDLVQEHQLLRSARAVLASDPKRALAITEEHRRRFPAGMLTQEREVIAIDALSRLGRSDAARTRADRFDESYPDSPHRDRVDQTAAGSGGARR